MTEPAPGEQAAARTPLRYQRALAITMVSFALWTFWNVGRAPCHANEDFSCGVFSDHFAHVALARIFPTVGFDIYEGPRGELGRALTPEEDAALPEDLRGKGARVVEGWPADKPFLASWPQIASFYPPGDLVMFAPAAALYHYTDLSWTQMNRLTIQLLLVYAHVSVFLMLLVNAGRARPERTDLIALGIAYFLVIRWTIDGFYDGGWIAPLVLAPVFLARGAGFGAVTAFTMSTFAHYRGLFLLPWAARGFLDVVRGRQWRPWTKGKTAATAATVVMGGLTTATFLIAREAMSAHQMTNPFNPAFGSFDPANLIALGLVTVPAALFFAWKRAWLDAVTVSWIVLLITRLPEAHPWDAVALVPWLVAPAVSPKEKEPFVRQVRALTAVLVMSVVFGSPLDAGWFRHAIDQAIS